MSTSNVDEPSKILLIHGNCPRCKHYHKGTPVHIHASEDPSDATQVPCENCELPWLTIGGRNKTQTSLLSSQTIDPDTEENSFRRAVFKFVRSATALDSVPEATVREQIHDDRSRSPSNDAQRRQDTTADYEAISPRIARDGVPNNNTNPMPPSTQGVGSARQVTKLNRKELAKALLDSVKRKVRSHLSVLKKVSVHRHAKSHSSGSRVDATEHPLPNEVEQKSETARPESPAQASTHGTAGETDSAAQHVQGDKCPPAKTTARAIEELKSFGKDKLRAMTNEERTAWIREQITAFKCRCSRQCTCRTRRASSSVMIDSSTQVHILPPLAFDQLPRRHSLEGIGSHLCYFGPGEFMDGRSLSITTAGSVTRTSEADTIVDNTISSSARNSLIGIAQERQWPLTSLRPASLLTLWHSQSYAHHRLQGRGSMDCIVAAGVPRSSSRGGRLRLERFSLPPAAIPSRPETPGLAHHVTTALAEAPRETPPTSLPEASTPRVNGYLTDDERNQPSNAPSETQQP